MKPTHAIKLCPRADITVTVTPDKIILGGGSVDAVIPTHKETLTDVVKRLRMFHVFHERVECLTPLGVPAKHLVTMKEVKISKDQTLTLDVVIKDPTPPRGKQPRVVMFDEDEYNW